MCPPNLSIKSAKEEMGEKYNVNFNVYPHE